MKTLNFKIDYKNPQKYLAQGKQTCFIFSDAEFEKVKKEIGEIKKDKDLHKVINFIHKGIPHVKSKQNFDQFGRTAKEIFESKVYTGCTDYALVFSTIARQFCIPTVYMSAADLEWIKEVENNLPQQIVRGHDTCECFVNDKWVHVDPARRWIDGTYDEKKEVVEYGDRLGPGKVFYKGTDLFEAGIMARRQMTELMRKLVVEDIK